MGRIRRFGDGSMKFMFKSEADDRLLSHRKPFDFEITAEDAERIEKKYPLIAEVFKIRQYFKQERENLSVPGEYRYTLCLDDIRGMGQYTEIRARGTEQETHSKELLAFATELGFTPSDILEGNYLHRILERQAPNQPSAE
jgi:adenylate cyclase class IV